MAAARVVRLVKTMTPGSARVAEVYRRWIDFSRFSEFIEPIQQVRPLGDGRYHWIGRLLGTQ